MKRRWWYWFIVDHWFKDPCPHQDCWTRSTEEEILSEIPDDVCCCGESMENHTSPIDCGHSPLSMRDHYLRDKEKNNCGAV